MSSFSSIGSAYKHTFNCIYIDKIFVFKSYFQFIRIHLNTPKIARPKGSNVLRRGSVDSLRTARVLHAQDPVNRRKSLSDASPQVVPGQERPSELTELYTRLQGLLPCGDAKRLWPKTVILKRAKHFIHELRKGDLELELATEILIQENFRLKHKMKSLEKRSASSDTDTSKSLESS